MSLQRLSRAQGGQCGGQGREWVPATVPLLSAARTLMSRRVQIDYYCRLDCLWKNKFKKEHEEFETMENVNRLLLENVLPAHVAAHFIGDKLNEVRAGRGSVTLGEEGTEVQRPAGLQGGFYLQNALRGSWPHPCAPDSGGFGVRHPGGQDSPLP